MTADRLSRLNAILHNLTTATIDLEILNSGSGLDDNEAFTLDIVVDILREQLLALRRLTTDNQNKGE